MVWGAASELTDQLSWEAIPQAELDKARSHGLAEAERVVRQDRQPIWASSQKFQDVRKRLKLSEQFAEAAEKARQEGDTVASPLMPDQLNGKVLTATLKNGRAICPELQTDECPNPADACPFGVHLCTILQKSGRACGGKHGAGVCNIKRAVMAASSVPAAPKPSATLVPAALGDKAKFTRKRTAAAPAEGATDDDVADVMRAAVKRARGVAAPKTPPKAKSVAAPKTPPKAMPQAPLAASKVAPGKPQIKAMPKKGHGKRAGDSLDQHLERLGVGSGTAQAPTCIWTSRKGGKLFLAGLPMRQTVGKFPKTALQICCFSRIHQENSIPWIGEGLDR